MGITGNPYKALSPVCYWQVHTCPLRRGQVATPPECRNKRKRSSGLTACLTLPTAEAHIINASSTHKHMHTNTYTQTHAHKHIHTQTQHTQTHTHTNTYICIHTQTHTQTHTHTHTNTHKNINTHTHTHTHLIVPSSCTAQKALTQHAHVFQQS